MESKSRNLRHLSLEMAPGVRPMNVQHLDKRLHEHQPRAGTARTDVTEGEEESLRIDLSHLRVRHSLRWLDGVTDCGCSLSKQPGSVDRCIL